MSEELSQEEKQIEGILTRWFKDPVDKPCPYCEAMKEVGQFIHQARQEVAREIFEEIEKGCGGNGNDMVSLWDLLHSNYWQSLKSKYLYCIDCNGEVAVKLEDCPKFKEER